MRHCPLLLPTFILPFLLPCCTERPLDPQGDGVAAQMKDMGPPPDAGDLGDEVCPVHWKCDTDPAGQRVCQMDDPLGLAGLPSPEGNWQCHMIHTKSLCEWPSTPAQWLCAGEVPAREDPPGRCGWQCAVMDKNEGMTRYRCLKEVVPEDSPPGEMGPAECLPLYYCSSEPEDPLPPEGCYVCVKGSAFNGTRCTLTPNQAGWPQMKYPYCLVGQRMWCSDSQYSGWGRAECDPTTGRWRTVIRSSGEEIDCHGFADGLRPDTLCACYHFYYNPACCERPDCVIPEGATGQICPQSPGRLCDYCNPQNPECTGEGARCVVTDSHETFCSQACDLDDPGSCPEGFACMEISLQSGIIQQCVPEDRSCYY